MSDYKAPETPEEFAALQAELAERVIPDYACKTCEQAPLIQFPMDLAWFNDGPLTESEFKLANEFLLRGHIETLKTLGFESMQNHAGFVRYCTGCKTRKPVKWIADIEPAKFMAYVQAQTSAFALDDLRVRLAPTGGFELL